MADSKRKVKILTGPNSDAVQSYYIEWINEKGNTISNINEQFSVSNDTFYIAVFFDKELE